MLPMVPLFGGNEGDVVFALLGKLLRIEDNGTSISASTLLLLKKKKFRSLRFFFWSSEIRLRTGKCKQQWQDSTSVEPNKLEPFHT